MANIFREALDILNKNGERTEEEERTLSAAMIPFTIRGCPLPDDITVGEALEELAEMVEGKQ